MNFKYNKKANDRLDQFLTTHGGDFSRVYWQKSIKDGCVTVNDKITSSPAFRLSEGDEIKIVKKIEKPAKNNEAKIEPTIIAENDDWIVINKPAGLASQIGIDETGYCLLDWFKKYFPAWKKNGLDPVRPGLVHRLDKLVSGIMVLAKTEAMSVDLKKQFKERLIEKKYLALVDEPISKPSGVIDFPLIRGLKGKISAKPNQERLGRPAITEFTVLKNFPHASYIEINLKTGRTHQIRAHFLAYGHPLVGDRRYRPKKKPDKSGLNRIWLHSHELSFNDLKGVRQTFTAPLPKELENYLAKFTPSNRRKQRIFG